PSATTARATSCHWSLLHQLRWLTRTLSSLRLRTRPTLLKLPISSRPTRTMGSGRLSAFWFCAPSSALTAPSSQVGSISSSLPAAGRGGGGVQLLGVGGAGTAAGT